jgi:hypothetical protein
MDFFVNINISIVLTNYPISKAIVRDKNIDETDYNMKIFSRS